MLVGPVHAVALLLLVAAATKLRDPAPAMGALAQAGLPARVLLVRLLATGEIGVAAAVLLLGGVAPALAISLLHLGFAAFLIRLRRLAGAQASCGCFGRSEAPAERLHVVVNVAASVLVALAALDSLPAFPSVLQERVGLAAPYVVAVVLGAWAVGLCLTSLPTLLAAQRPAAP